MTIRILALILSCLSVASASAGDAAAMLRDRFIFCNQFVVAESRAATIREFAGYCCPFGNRAHDCHIIDLEEPRR